MFEGRAKSSGGWAAFDLKQRQKQGVTTRELENEPYPPLPGSSLTSPPRPCNTTVTARSFSSVILPSVEFPTLSLSKVPDDSGNNFDIKTSEDNSRNSVLEKLRDLFSWTDNSLLEDVVVAVNNDFDNACRLLEIMGSSRSFNYGTSTATQNAELSLNSHNFPSDVNTLIVEEDVQLGMESGLAEITSTLEGCLNDKTIRPTGKSTSCRGLVCYHTADVEPMLEHLKSIPLEPDWEEDDIYLNHRKDAMKMMRSAAQNSKAATNCFLRGDHFSAQQHSLKARQEWSAAEKLNARAAKEILSIRNMENDIWKLDLHGLHAAEAIQALQEHLWMIETQVPMNHSSMSSNRFKTKNGIACSFSSESLGNMGMKLDGQVTLTRHRPASLQVITGRGNHSRGQAALPSAIRNFLNDNGYRFDEARPGVIKVRPKFRGL